MGHLDGKPPRSNLASIEIAQRRLAQRVSLDAQRYFCSEWCQFIWCCTGVLRYLPAAIRPGEFETFGVTLPKVKIYET